MERLRSVTVRSILLGLAVSTIACDDEPSPIPDPRTLGVGGGTVELAGVRLEVPPGALDRERTFEITATAEAAPRGYATYSPVFRFGPDGLVFGLPAKVTVPFDGDPAYASVHWSKLSGDGFQNLGGVVADKKITVEITHFSVGFVGSALVIAEPSADLGEVAMGDGATTRVSITNTGEKSLPLPEPVIEPAGGPFTFSGSTPAAIAAGSDGTLEVRFAPASAGPASATIRFPSATSAAVVAVDVSLDGRGAAPTGQDAGTSTLDATSSPDAQQAPDATAADSGPADSGVAPDSGSSCIPPGGMGCITNDQCCNMLCVTPKSMCRP